MLHKQYGIKRADTTLLYRSKYEEKLVRTIIVINILVSLLLTLSVKRVYSKGSLWKTVKLYQISENNTEPSQ